MSLRSRAHQESLLVNFVFTTFVSSLLSWILTDVPGSVSLCPGDSEPIFFCISGITLSLIAELMALLIWEFIMFIRGIISWENLMFITFEKPSIDSNNLSCLGISFSALMFLILFSCDSFPLVWEKAQGYYNKLSHWWYSLTLFQWSKCFHHLASRLCYHNRTVSPFLFNAKL